MNSQTIKLLKKEMKLGNTVQTFIWTLCCFCMYFIPRYPSYIGPFYITLCIMMTFALNQSSHDILYTVLLPVRKIDTVKARFLYCGLIEVLSLVLAVIPTLLRVFSIFPENHAGINTTIAYFGLQLIVYSVFNLIFLGNVYKDPLKPGLRYLVASIAYFIMYAVCELPVWVYYATSKKLAEGTISELPKLALAGQMFTDMSGAFIIRQSIILFGGVMIFAGVWALTFTRAAKQFEKYDL